LRRPSSRCARCSCSVRWGEGQQTRGHAPLYIPDIGEQGIRS
jgi:hypothetical protein